LPIYTIKSQQPESLDAAQVTTIATYDLSISLEASFLLSNKVL
jgi:hypothetical protein